MTAAIPVPLGRDYGAEMRALLEKEMTGSAPAPVVAARVAARLRATDPDLLSGWLDVQAVSLLRDAIGRIDSAVRSHARATAGRSAFKTAEEEGDVSGFLDARYVVDDQRHRLPLKELARDHLLYVARGYEQTAKYARMEAAFFRALAKKVGSGVVGDLFTEDQIVQMRSSIT